MTYLEVRAGLVAVMLALVGPALAGPLDPDWSVAKAARGAATTAVVGVRGNRCDAAETTRDALGIDDRDRIGDGDRIEDRDRNRNDNDGVLNKGPQRLITSLPSGGLIREGRDDSHDGRSRASA